MRPPLQCMQLEGNLLEGSAASSHMPGAPCRPVFWVLRFLFPALHLASASPSYHCSVLLHPRGLVLMPALTAAAWQSGLTWNLESSGLTVVLGAHL